MCFAKKIVSCFCILCAEVLLHVNVNLLRIENFENCGDDEEEVERMLNTSMGSVELRSCYCVICHGNIAADDHDHDDDGAKDAEHEVGVSWGLVTRGAALPPLIAQIPISFSYFQDFENI